jgi:hypothetical protein
VTGRLKGRRTSRMRAAQPPRPQRTLRLRVKRMKFLRSTAPNCPRRVGLSAPPRPSFKLDEIAEEIAAETAEEIDEEIAAETAAETAAEIAGPKIAWFCSSFYSFRFAQEVYGTSRVNLQGSPLDFPSDLPSVRREGVTVAYRKKKARSQISFFNI